jgi:hypothetical protein
VAEPLRTSFVAECFWAGVTEEDLRALDQRAEATAAQLARDGESIRYLGSMLMHEDEVILCLFEGEAAAVRRAAQQAGIPFERILESTHSRGGEPRPQRTGRGGIS